MTTEATKWTPRTLPLLCETCAWYTLHCKDVVPSDAPACAAYHTAEGAPR